MKNSIKGGRDKVISKSLSVVDCSQMAKYIHSFIQLLIYSFDLYLLSIYYITGTVLGTVHPLVSKTDIHTGTVHRISGI